MTRPRHPVKRPPLLQTVNRRNIKASAVAPAQVAVERVRERRRHERGLIVHDQVDQMYAQLVLRWLACGWAAEPEPAAA